ncbi:aspartate aminotransferase family protein [Methylibium petroleiphilum]|uniref:aspartate aminotransferase family protein n=1 Tax=Methylibium petroleiphilum TaxID=105560 RepID=UPI001ACC68C9|nr:aspartate aminotransferase family protein [Methylibium petroleiphilum]MBN9203797.1 aspartate aminotransferase family protein [Methylibium petroleiphilum]
MSRTTQAWQAADAAHFLHPFTDFDALAKKGSRIIERAENIYLWDSEGHKILDAMSGLWCVNVGYGRQELIDAATAQLKQLPFYNAFFQTATPPAIELAELLSEVTPPQFKHVFFSGSGSEGNDTVVRMVRRYWDVLGQPERKVIISRNNAYHGSTMAGASLGGMSGMHAQGGLPIPDITHIEQPYWYELGRPQGLSRDDFGRLAASWLEKKILEVGPERVAAFIGEPVQGAGGVIIPPATYWPAIQAICDKYGILLVSDEVICGFGRTGRWWGCETMGTRPDLMTFAKGVTSGYIPLGGVMVGERVARVLIEQGGEFNHGYTYSGHPVACAVALANIRLIQRERLVDRVRDDLGPYLAQHFEALKAHPLVGDAETCGLMGAVVLTRDKASGTPFASDLEVGMVCRGHCFGNGLIMRAVGDRMIIAPPLVMTRDQIDEMMVLIKRCLDLTWADVKARGWV